MSVIETEEVRKAYGPTQALDDVSFAVDDGEVVGVLGPNGAGKTTLVNVLTGQDSRDGGSAWVLGLDPDTAGTRLRRRLGILPEREDPPSFLTGREYLEFVADVRGTTIDIDAWQDRFLLEGKLDTVTMDLSKGERQKLMLIQAFFHDPSLVFIDEPLINLDPVVQERAKDLFHDYVDDGGTILLCTHVLSLAAELCDRVLLLKDGARIDEMTDMEHLKDAFLAEV